MNTVDHIMARTAYRQAGALKFLGDIETCLMRRRLDPLPIEMPVFITGLARAGTTILLETLAKGDGIATHRYRDFPFILSPVIWNRFIARFSGNVQETERPHHDGIRINRESPEAFEEVIWQYFFPFLHTPGCSHLLDEHTDHPGFERFYPGHIKKMLVLRAGRRYLAKANYHLTRIAYLNRILPDARFIVMVRHPFGHIASLVHQHRLFTGYAAQDTRVGAYLEAAGHYEFGPQRVPVCISQETGTAIQKAWQERENCRGYAMQWAHVYEYLGRLLTNPVLNKQIMVIRHEDLCTDSHGEIKKVLVFCELAETGKMTEAAGKIKARPPSVELSAAEKEICRQITEPVARRFAYSF